MCAIGEGITRASGNNKERPGREPAAGSGVGNSRGRSEGYQCPFESMAVSNVPETVEGAATVTSRILRANALRTHGIKLF